MIASQKAKGLGGYLGLLRGLRLADLAPEVPAVAEYSTGETMGRSSEKLAARWGVSRADSDAFALRSHKAAAAAHAAGLLQGEIVAVNGNTWDNIIKAECVGGGARWERGCGARWELVAVATHSARQHLRAIVGHFHVASFSGSSRQL